MSGIKESKRTQGDETKRLDCVVMLLAQTKMIYDEKRSQLHCSHRMRQSDIRKSVSCITVGYSQFLVSAARLNIFLSDASIHFVPYFSCIVYFIDYVMQSYRWYAQALSSCYIMYTILNVSITNRAASAPIREIRSSSRKTMTLVLILFFFALLGCVEIPLPRLCENGSINVSRHEWLAGFGRCSS